MSYTVYVTTHPADPDDDVLAEDVLAARHDSRAQALAEARAISASERTVTMVYDTARQSRISGGPILIALYERGRPA